MMCDFKFIDFAPEEIIKILEHDIKQHQRKHDYHMGLAKFYGDKIEELEIKIDKLRLKALKEKSN